MRLRYTGSGFNYLPRHRVGSLLSGRRRSRLRGRGLDFDELRNYRPGDDIRNMDWRVTNRTGRPHVRVYNEERDRPVFAVVDQRLPMFFGSALKVKSVIAAEVAALTAWRVLAVGDRIGALLFNDDQCIEIKPTRSEKQVVGWLGNLTAMNNALHVHARQQANAEGLTEALEKLEAGIGHDHLIVLISDFFGCTAATYNAIRRLRQHNDVICAQVFDPLERDISSAHKLVVSDGQYQLELDPHTGDLGKKFEASVESAMAQVQSELRRHDIPVLPINTIEPVAAQLKTLLGGQKQLQ